MEKLLQSLVEHLLPKEISLYFEIILLFEKYPEIKTVYDRCCEFRDWMKKVEQDEVDELLNFKSLVERNMMPILNYFRFGATNAIAENINSRIQRFITINQGTGDRKFFYFWMKKYFSWHLNLIVRPFILHIEKKL
ncbi:MAG: transposase [Prevotellaceae bacterium]|jgi:hypothetical protein|nr:transposase [Prevotellaceae bacterium]